MRVIVTGGRHRTDWQTIWADLNQLMCAPSVFDGVRVVHGANPNGADKHAADWCAVPARGVVEETHPADWATQGKAAGMRRNATMVDLGADLLLAYPDPTSIGTWGCVGLARKAGIPVRIRRLANDPPKRIQRQRTAGWRLPAGAVCVDRTSRYGNPFTVADATEAGYEQPARTCVANYEAWLAADEEGYRYRDAYTIGARTYDRRWIRDHIGDLAGHDLACYCPTNQRWCHATTLLALAGGSQLLAGGGQP